MKAYGAKRSKKMVGDGCFLCTRERKRTKSATRSKAKADAKKEARVAVKRGVNDVRK